MGRLSICLSERTHPCGQAPDGPGDGRVVGVIAPAEGLTEKMKQQRQMPSPDGRCPKKVQPPAARRTIVRLNP
jgi:hypothetical protein